MRLDARFAVVTTLLVAPMLAASQLAALKVRRGDLEADLGREAREIAEALRAGIEPIDPDTAEETLLERARAARANNDPFQLEVLRVGTERRTDDQAWLLLVQAAEI